MPKFRFKPDGHSSPMQKIGIGVVEPRKTYELEGDAAAQARRDPEFEAVVPKPTGGAKAKTGAKAGAKAAKSR